MALSTLELNEVVDLVRAEIRRLYPEANLADFTDWSLDAEILARLFLGNQEQALYALRSRWARTCPDDQLDNLAASYGTRRQAAAKFAGSAIALSNEAGAAASIPAGLVARAEDGTEFVTTGPGTTAVDAFAPSITVAAGSSRDRLVLAPGISQLSQGEVIRLSADFGGAFSWHAVRDLLSQTSAIDVWPPLRIDLSVGAAVDASWGCVVPIEAVEPGIEGLRGPWTRLEWDPATKPADLDTHAIVCLLSGGGNLESNDELRARLIALEAGAQGVGTAMDYVRWAMGTPDVRVAKAFAFPNFVLQGVITVVCLGVARARELGPDALERIEAHVAGQMPAVGASLDVRTASYATEVAITATVSPRVGAEPDWTRGTNPSRFEIDATGTDTTRINFTEDPSSTIEVGDRVLVPTEVGGRKKTVQRVVTVVDGTGITIGEAVEAIPVGGDYVYAGGPIAQQVLDAIESLVDEMGPGVYVGDVEFVRVPGPSTSSPGSIRNGRALGAVIAVPGVESATIEIDGLEGGDFVASALTAPRAGRIYVDWSV
jgi:uncharacterized phage protein gp47/JayE